LEAISGCNQCDGQHNLQRDLQEILAEDFVLYHATGHGHGGQDVSNGDDRNGGSNPAKSAGQAFLLESVTCQKISV
jgi:hypothetical protein